MDQRLGFLGGSFDPPHLGHIGLSQAVRTAARLDRVILVPAARNPLKPEPTEWPDAVRRAALERLAATEPGLGLWTGDLDRPPPSYAIDTVVGLERDFPDAERWWIVGADSVATLPRWHRAAELVERIGFLGVARPGVDAEAATATARAALPGLRLRWVETPQWNISSSEIRRLRAFGQPWQHLVPAAIRDLL